MNHRLDGRAVGGFQWLEFREDGDHGVAPKSILDFLRAALPDSALSVIDYDQ